MRSVVNKTTVNDEVGRARKKTTTVYFKTGLLSRNLQEGTKQNREKLSWQAVPQPRFKPKMSQIRTSVTGKKPQQCMYRALLLHLPARSRSRYKFTTMKYGTSIHTSSQRMSLRSNLKLSFHLFDISSYCLPKGFPSLK